MNLPRLANGVYRVAGAQDSTTAGLRPATFNVSCDCVLDPDLVRSCTCRWYGGGCYGGSTRWEDGDWESWYGCR
jgi:hypothetical protein